MSHSVAFASGLTADGVDLTNADLSILMRITEGLDEVWEVRGKDTTIPAMAGQIARNRKRDRLVITAEGMVMGQGADETAQRVDFVSTVATIRALMDPTQAPYTLTATRVDGSTASILARPVNVLWGDDGIPTYRALSCQWLAIDDDWLEGGS